MWNLRTGYGMGCCATALVNYCAIKFIDGGFSYGGTNFAKSWLKLVFKTIFLILIFKLILKF